MLTSPALNRNRKHYSIGMKLIEENLSKCEVKIEYLTKLLKGEGA